MSARHLLLTVAGLALVSAAIALYWRSAGSPVAASQHVDFNRDIRPIFNQNCNSCHGGVKQQGAVSFIYREEALGKGKSGRPTVVPGKPNASELIARVTSRDPEMRMPYHAPPLQPRQITLLKQWIKEGAHWEDYWAFVAPKPQLLPEVKQSGWIRQPLDRFVLARLEKESLSPSPEADKAALLRRVSFDLVGLPPTPEELSAFLADSSADAYGKQVDRLLASPHYGERWASIWLDLARYADTRGYDLDYERPGVWPYRDWVIDAFNRNLPYDQFVIKQLAGDLLPDATIEDRTATSFHRQTPQNDECGTDDEEFRLVAAMDRVATTWSVLDGVTINCVQCHSHPYDPIRHTDYYKFLAFFNTSRDADLLLDDSPVLRVPKDKSRRDEAARLEQVRAKLLREIVDEGKSKEARAAWTPLPVAKAVIDEVPALERYLAELKRARHEGNFPFTVQVADDEAKKSAKELRELRKQYLDSEIVQTTSRLDDSRHKDKVSLSTPNGEVRAVGNVPVRSVYELLMEPARSALTAVRIEVPPKDAKKARHSPEDGFFVDRIEAWNLPSQGPEQKIKFRYFVPDSEENLASALKSESKADAISGGAGAFAANSKLFRARWVIGILEEPLPAGTRLKLQLSHSKEIAAKPAAVKQVRVATSDDARWTGWAGGSLRENLVQLVDVESHLAVIPSVPLPVMVEQAVDDRRETLEFERGDFLNQIGPALVPDVPALFPKLPADVPRNRLTMARWFFAPGQPLTARVAVNRYWEQLFGLGLVETLEDFGSAGEMPSHPELLDWLALHFQNDLHWDMKQLLKEMVSSSTYRQSAKTTSALLQRDPRNRLLARGPQQRLAAEMVRDQALAASGLLTPTIGGPSVMPPQPAGVSADYISLNWVDAKGPDRYRRAIYTFLKRTSIYPSLTTFDASAHSVSLARRIPTNTPLQALVTLNDPVYQEAEEALAKRILAKSAAGVEFRPMVDSRLIYGTQTVLSRDPTPRELESLRNFYQQTLASYKTKRATRASGKNNSGAAVRPTSGELAAWTAVAGVLLNLDAALTR
jgi:mono/diheme cytochrome c family protein